MSEPVVLRISLKNRRMPRGIPHLPIELYHEIISWLKCFCSPQEWSKMLARCSVVSRAFRDICIPQMFEKVTVRYVSDTYSSRRDEGREEFIFEYGEIKHSDGWRPPVRPGIVTLKNFRTFLESKPCIASSVKTLRLEARRYFTHDDDEVREYRFGYPREAGFLSSTDGNRACATKPQRLLEVLRLVSKLQKLELLNLTLSHGGSHPENAHHTSGFTVPVIQYEVGAVDYQYYDMNNLEKLLKVVHCNELRVISDMPRTSQ